MIIETVNASDFGPLSGEKLDPAPGMTIIYGPNESGKSSWHAAIFAALCGMRRAKGRQQVDDREFREKHKPWQSSLWRVDATIRLADGRRVEMRQDLDGRVDCKATDLALGRDCSNEIMFEGSPDASRWLGFNRRSFPAIAFVRQADILEVKSQAEALQRHIQRAADTAGVDQTAAAALSKIEEFRAVNTGLVRANSNRPLASATRLVDSSQRNLEASRQQQASYLGLVANVASLQEKATASEARLQLFRVAVAGRDADAAQDRLNRVVELQRTVPDGEPAPLSTDDDLAQDVSAALKGWAQRPTPTTLSGASVDDLRSEIERLPGRPVGDTAPAAAVVTAHAGVAELDARLADHAAAMPARPPQSVNISAPTAKPPTSAASALLALPGVGALLMGIVLLALGATVPGGILAAAGLAGLALFWIAKTRRASAPTTGAGAAPAAPGEDYESRLLQWQNTSAELDQTRSAALAALAEALRSRGVGVQGTGRDSIMAAYDLYVRQCEERQVAASRAAKREDLESRLKDRLQAEAAAATVNQQIRRAQANVLAASARCGVAASTVSDAETALKAWLRDRSVRLKQDQDRRASWTELQALLDGCTFQDLEAELQRARERADKLGAGLTGSIEVDQDIQQQGEAVEAVAAEDRRAVHQAIGMVDERRKFVPDIALAEENLARAQTELQRLRRLDEVLQRTHEFLTKAQDSVHRSIAPVLAAGVESWLPQLTAGRYEKAYVDPETLDVQVAGADGMLRYAHLLSHGTAEQIYLLLRAVMAQHLTVPGEVCPLILDDVTVHCDVQRQSAMLCALHQLSAERQVIVFTQEDNVYQWARQQLTTSRDRVIRLPAPKPLIV